MYHGCNWLLVFKSQSLESNPINVEGQTNNNKKSLNNIYIEKFADRRFLMISVATFD